MNGTVADALCLTIGSQCIGAANGGEAIDHSDVSSPDPAEPKSPSTTGGRTLCEVRALPEALSRDVQSFARRHSVTTFMTTLAAFQVVLHRYSGLQVLTVAILAAEEDQEASENRASRAASKLVRRSDCSEDPSFLSLVNRTVGAPDEGEDLSGARGAMTEIAFAFEDDLPEDGKHSPALEAEGFDLVLCLTQAPEGLSACLFHDSALVGAPMARRVLESFLVVLAAAIRDPASPISRLPILSDAERTRLIASSGLTTTAYPRDRCVHELFEDQAAARPEAIALESGDHHLTYEALNRRANMLAFRLRQAGVGPRTRVGLCLERSSELVISMIAILKAGAAYVPLDSSLPEERRSFMIEDAGVAVLVTSAALRGAFQTSRAPAYAILCVDDPPPALPASAGANAPAGATAESLAYVCYTSGSTGKPKGVAVPHRGVVRLVKNTDYADMGPDEVFLLAASTSFDASTFEIWAPLLNGARLAVLPPPGVSLEGLGSAVRRHGVTTLWLTTGLFNLMVDERVEALCSLRQILTGGEVMSVPHLEKARKALPRCRIIHCYGPTESTTFTTACTLPEGPVQLIQRQGRSPVVESADRPSTVPVGRPIANTTVYILDRHREPVPVGVTGEIFIGGDGLAREYLNAPDLTADKFVKDPFDETGKGRLYRSGDLGRYLEDGAIEFQGRVDRQVKLRGFRIEPGEIEQTLLASPEVRACVVDARRDDGDHRLVAYVVPASLEPREAALRAYLGQRLPEYMIPSSFVFLPSLPLNPNGKVDRSSLPPPLPPTAHVDQTGAAPRDPIEAELARLWRDVLGVDRVGISDNFFELGGHSLLGAQLIDRIQQELGVTLPLATIFEAQTIEAQGRVLRGDALMRPQSALVELERGTSERQIFWIHSLGGDGGGGFFHYRRLARALAPEWGAVGVRAPQTPHGRIEDMALAYMEEIRAHQPRGPYTLGGFCFGGVVAFEIARRLHSMGEEVPLLLLIESALPQAATSPSLIGWAGHARTRVGRFLSLPSSEQAHRLRRRGLHWAKKALACIPGGEGLRPSELAEIIDLSAYPREYIQAAEIHWRALKAYTPAPYHGRAALFRTPPRGQSRRREDDGWGRWVTGGVHVCMVPGTHETLLDEPNVQVLAREVKSRLAAHHELGG